MVKDAENELIMIAREFFLRGIDLILSDKRKPFLYKNQFAIDVELKPLTNLNSFNKKNAIQNKILIIKCEISLPIITARFAVRSPLALGVNT
jgi:hypothetical protein